MANNTYQLQNSNVILKGWCLVVLVHHNPLDLSLSGGHELSCSRDVKLTKLNYQRSQKSRKKSKKVKKYKVLFKRWVQQNK